VKHSLREIELKPETLHKSELLYRKNEEDIENYIDLLLEWNEKINLVSRNVSRETVREHVIHSLIPVGMGLLDDHGQWIDSGTGGGLPGIPLAICLPDKRWILNDNVKKKMRAVADITERLGLTNCEIEAKSISLLNFEKGTGIVTKHAFKIEDLLRLLGSKPWKTIIMWKGADDAVQEIVSSRKKLQATICRFSFGSKHPFYEGKGLVKIER
jgi:16S rRNA (guanine527-N7)-methyltransferase